MNTAKKHEFSHPVLDSLFNDHKAQGVVSNLALKSVDEILNLQRYFIELSNLSPQVTKEQKVVFESYVAKINAILMSKIDISMDLYGVSEDKAIAQLDASGMPTSASDIDKVMPKEKEGKTVPLNQLPDLGEKPEQKILTDTCKSLMSEGKDKEALILARKYLGKGKYIPKKEKATASEWDEGKIKAWLKSIKGSITTPIPEKTVEKKEEKPVKAETNFDKETMDALKGAGLKDAEIKEFGSMCDTYEDEVQALDNLQILYSDLNSKGEEDKAVAEILLKAFFSGRKYSSKGIQAWIDYALDEKNTDSDHWKYLGRIGTEDGLLGGAPSYKELEEAVIEKLRNGMSNEDIIDGLKDKVVNKVILDEKSNNYNMYTPLHAQDLLETLCDENAKEFKAPEKKKEEKESGEESAQKGTNTDSNSEEESQKTVKNVPSESGTQKEKEKSKSVSSDTKPVNLEDFKAKSLKIIRNGGIFDDFFLMPVAEKALEAGIKSKEGHKTFKTEDELKDYLKPIFEEVHDVYDKNRKHYPFGQMMALIRLAEENEIPVEDFVNENLSLVKRKDGSFLELKNKEESITFEKDEDFKTFVESKYEFFKKTRDEKKESDSKRIEDIKAKQSKDASQSEKDKLQKKVDERLSSIEKKDTKETTEFDINKEMKDVESVNDIKPFGLELIKKGASLEDLKTWGRAKILNKKLKELDEKSVYSSEELVDKLIEGMFRKEFSEEKESLTHENVEAELKELAEVENATRATIWKGIKTYLEENDAKGMYTTNELAEKVMNALKNAGITEKAKDSEESVEISKVSENDKELWEVIKGFKELDEVYNQALELREGEEWEKGLAMAIELIVDNNQIEDAKGWTVEQVSDWFNKMINPDPKASEKSKDVEDAKIVEDEKKEDKEDTKWDFSTILSAGSKSQYKKALFEFVQNNEMTKACRNALVEAVNNDATGGHAKKVAKSDDRDIHSGINNALSKIKEAEKA